jgi:hypothetical protein
MPFPFLMCTAADSAQFYLRKWNISEFELWLLTPRKMMKM